MPFSFPASPTVGQTSTQNGRTYTWTGYAWELVAASGSGEDALLRSIFVPPAPTGLTATAGNAQVTLSWTAPTGVIAQAPITDYAVQFSSDNGTTWTTFTAAASTATSATVTGLTNGTAYVFRVAAVNAIGVGAYTAASSSVTPIAGTPPNAPTSLTATPGNAQIALAWTVPSAPGTSAITGYTVEYTPSGGSATTVNTGSTATSYTLTGLTNGTSHSVRVRGVSAAGNGDYSTAVTGTPSAGATLSQTTAGATGLWSGSGTSSSPFTRSANWNMTFGNSPSFTVSGAGRIEFRADFIDATNDGDGQAYVVRTRSGASIIVFERQYGSKLTQSASFSVENGDIIRFADSAPANGSAGDSYPRGANYGFVGYWQNVSMWATA